MAALGVYRLLRKAAWTQEVFREGDKYGGATIAAKMRAMDQFPRFAGPTRQ